MMRFVYSDLELAEHRPTLALEEMRAGPVMVRADARRIPLPDDSVDVVVTSPPYLAQRTYGAESDHELGGEGTLAEYVTALADVFDELRRIMRPGAFAWMNIGDKANYSGGAGGDWSRPGNSRTWSTSSQGPGWFRDPAYAPQTFLDVPGAIVRELLRRGWRLRLAITWEKTGTREAASMKHLGRPLMSSEMIYLLADTRGARDPRPRFYPSQLAETGSVWHFPPRNRERRPDEEPHESHLAPFPDELARRCILPTTLPGDVVFDPFGGSGTVPRVAASLGRHGIGTDIYAGRPDLIHGIETAPTNGWTTRNTRRQDTTA